MANVVEYTLSERPDHGKLNKINITNNRALEVWAKVEQRVNSASNTMQKCGVTLGSLRERVDARRAEREWIPASNINAIRRTNIEVKALERQIRQLERVNGGKIKTMLSDAFNSIPFANTLTNPIVMAGMAGFKGAANRFRTEKVQVAFDVLLRGDTKASEALREEIPPIRDGNTLHDSRVAGCRENDAFIRHCTGSDHAQHQRRWAIYRNG